MTNLTTEKLKTISEIREMLKDESDTLNYIDRLHSIIRDYQIIIDVAVSKNKNIK